MANRLSSLFVELGVNSAAFSEGLQKSSYQLQQFGRQTAGEFRRLGNSLSTLSLAFGAFGPKGAAFASAVSLSGQAAGKAVEKFARFGKGIGVITGIAAGAGVAALSLAGALATSAIAGAEVIERFKTMSEKTGIAVHDLQVLEAAGATVGVGLDKMIIAMRKFDETITGMAASTSLTKNILTQLGVTSHDNKEALYEVADAFSRMRDGAQKAAYAAVLFGRSGLDMIPMLNRGRKGIEDFEKDVDQYGPKIDASAIAANDRWRRSTEDLSLSWDKAKVSFSGLLNAISDAVGSFAFFMSSDEKMKLTLAGLAQQAGITALSLRIMAGTIKDAGKADFTAGGFAAAKDLAGRMQEELNRKVRTQYEIIKAGSKAAYELEQKRADLATAISAGLYQQAIAIQKQVNALERVVEQQKTNAAAFSKAYENATSFEQRGIKRKAPGRVQLPDISNLTQIVSPDVAAASAASAAMADAAQAQLTEGKNALRDFWAEHQRGMAQTKQQIIAGYEEEYAVWFDLLQQRMISQQQFNAVVAQLTLDEKTALRGTVAVFNEIDNGLKALGESMAHFIVTGQGGFRRLGQQFEENFLKTGLTNVFSNLGHGFENIHKAGGFKGGLAPHGGGPLGMLGSLLGFGKGKPLGSSPMNPMYTKDAGSILGGKGKEGAGGLLGKIPGLGGGGIFSKIFSFASMFGGFLAQGGDVTPGRAYVVGEKHPEFFVPRSPGTVATRVNFEPGHPTQNNINVSAHMEMVDTSGGEEFLHRHAQAAADAVTHALRQRGVI